jgi:hypothetical protein
MDLFGSSFENAVTSIAKAVMGGSNGAASSLSFLQPASVIKPVTMIAANN